MSHSTIPSASAQTSRPIVQQADRLNQNGFSLLQQGQARAALQSWQQATELFKQMRDSEGVAGTQINQAIALQALGLYPKACDTLVATLELPTEVCLPFQQDTSSPSSIRSLSQQLQQQPAIEVQLIGLRVLGDTLRLLGKLQESVTVFSHAQQMATALRSQPETHRIAVGLAMTYRLQFDQARNNLLRTDDPNLQETLLAQIKNDVTHAAQLYERTVQGEATDTAVKIQAKLNTLSLGVALMSWLQGAGKVWQNDLSNLVQPLQARSTTYAQDFAQHSDLLSTLPAIDSIYSRLNLAQTILSSDRLPELQSWFGDRSTFSLLNPLVNQAINTARKINNYRALSYSLGMLAKVLSQESGDAVVQQTYEQALAYAQAVGAWDVAYQWQAALGQLYQQRHQVAQAKSAYQAAIGSLDRVRGNISTINPEIQFSFKEKVEPIYRNYLRFLLAQPQPDLTEIIQVNESLQVAQLENFLGCGKLDLVSLSQINALPHPPTLIHAIDLGDKIEIIINAPHQQIQHYSIDETVVHKATENLLANLQSPQLSQLDPTLLTQYTQILYQLILEPAKIQRLLPQSGTLLFVLDNSLQNIPMNLLHDGQQFLLEQYQIAVLPGSQIRSPKSMASDRLRALIAGLSEASPSLQDPLAPRGLSPLPAVESEIHQIQQSLDRSVVLLNQDFTLKNLQSRLRNSTFPIVHISTHGQFSSDPLQTLLLAWDQVMDTYQLSRLLQLSQTSRSPGVELLVLSACQTAKGDRRSALGIAGIAAQAGARSTIATLWVVDAESTAVLMAEFYRCLKMGMPKAEALRQAQLSLLHSTAFNHPYYWSGFILVGSWL